MGDGAFTTRGSISEILYLLGAGQGGCAVGQRLMKEGKEGAEAQGRAGQLGRHGACYDGRDLAKREQGNAASWHTLIHGSLTMCEFLCCLLSFCPLKMRRVITPPL